MLRVVINVQLIVAMLGTTNFTMLFSFAMWKNLIIKIVSKLKRFLLEITPIGEQEINQLDWEKIYLQI